MYSGSHQANDEAAAGAAAPDARPLFDRGRFLAHGTVTWPPGLAAGGAFGSIILAIAGFSGGYVSLGTAGLVVLGLAIGFTGRLRARLLLALTLWAVHAALAVACTATGPGGLAAITPAVYVVLAVATGQGIAVVASTALYRPRR